jgi:hypothetical protein
VTSRLKRSPPIACCADLLAVASAAGFERFAYWAYSAGAPPPGLQLAARTDRLTALVLGGWPPLGAPYAGILQATRLKQANPEPSSLKVLRSKDQYRQWETYYASMLNWPEAESVARIACPKMAFFGGEGDLVEAGIPIRIASIIREQRAAARSAGLDGARDCGPGPWRVHGARVGGAACAQLPRRRADVKARIAQHLREWPDVASDAIAWDQAALGDLASYCESQRTTGLLVMQNRRTVLERNWPVPCRQRRVRAALPAWHCARRRLCAKTWLRSRRAWSRCWPRSRLTMAGSTWNSRCRTTSAAAGRRPTLRRSNRSS